jgi:hypothetical protein
MPVLHEYSQSYHKSGYYVKVNWSAPHPYPLQTPPITENIYSKLGFEPGDKVPNALTSRLFNAGLHWTEGNGPGDPSEQTNLESIDNYDFPDIGQEELNQVLDVLKSAESDPNIEEMNQTAIRDLQSELNSLVPKSNEAGTSRGGTIPILEDLLDEPVDQSRATEIRNQCANPGLLHKSVYQFVRQHPITPREFTINSHGDPTYTFQSGAISWQLSDCRIKQFSFDWAVTVAPNSERRFGLRVSDQGILRSIYDGNQLSAQQSADLITIIPCLYWTLDVLHDYSVSATWDVSGLYDDLSTEWQTRLDDQVHATLRAQNSSITPNEGVIIDRPEEQFARIRSPNRCILCTAVNSLPASFAVGAEVTFDLERRYGTRYATDVTSCDDWDVKISGENSTYTFDLPTLQEEDTATSDIVDALLSILEAVNPSVAVNNDTFLEYFLCVSGELSTIPERLLESLLADTPFKPDLFPQLVENLESHFLLAEEELSFQVLPLSLCVAMLYDEIDSQATIEEVDRQGDSTVLYQRDGNCLVVGDELLWYGFQSFKAVPTELRTTITKPDKSSLSRNILPRAVAALSEQQFYRDSRGGDSWVGEVIRAGLREMDLNVMYLNSQ